VLKRWRRRRTLLRHSIPDAAWREVLAGVPALGRLDAAAQDRLRELTLLFLHEKRIEPAIGFALDDAMRVRIAAMACQPILHLGLDSYAGFVAVVVHPGEFVIRNREFEDDGGVVHIGDDVLSGESWEHGPVVLSWRDIEASGQGDGYNVVVHEFAHKLDMLSGEPDGTPPLQPGMRLAEWRRVFDTAYEELVNDLERGAEPWIDPYAAEDPAEFFAVCAELFFDVPGDLADACPEIYGQLAACFGQDPKSGVSAPRDMA
jgi:Mlc titration factor MtfA (ptsG expression regulator)